MLYKEREVRWWLKPLYGKEIERPQKSPRSKKSGTKEMESAKGERM
jgi:hypothetical protein